MLKRYPAKVLPLTRKNHGGMVPEQFYLLQEGDVIRMNKPNGAHRIIERIHRGKRGETYGITLLKLQRSRYPNPYTQYGPGDAQQFLPVKVKDERIWEITYESAMAARREALRRQARQKIREHYKRLKRLYETLG